jgi:hypothetical protein
MTPDEITNEIRQGLMRYGSVDEDFVLDVPDAVEPPVASGS